MLLPASAAFDDRVRGSFCEELLFFLCKTESLLLGENFFLLCRRLQHNVHLSKETVCIAALVMTIGSFPG